MVYEDKASHDSTPPCSRFDMSNACFLDLQCTMPSKLGKVRATKITMVKGRGGYGNCNIQWL